MKFLVYFGVDMLCLAELKKIKVVHRTVRITSYVTYINDRRYIQNYCMQKETGFYVQNYKFTYKSYLD